MYLYNLLLKVCLILYYHACITMHVLPCITMYYHACITMHVLPCITMYYHVLPCITMHVLPCMYALDEDDEGAEQKKAKEMGLESHTRKAKDGPQSEEQEKTGDEPNGKKKKTSLPGAPICQSSYYICLLACL